MFVLQLDPFAMRHLPLRQCQTSTQIVGKNLGFAVPDSVLAQAMKYCRGVADTKGQGGSGTKGLKEVNSMVVLLRRTILKEVAKKQSDGAFGVLFMLDRTAAPSDVMKATK